MRWTITVVQLHRPLRRLPPLIVRGGTLADALGAVAPHLETHGIDLTQPYTLRMVVDAEEEAFTPPTRPRRVTKP